MRLLQELIVIILISGTISMVVYLSLMPEDKKQPHLKSLHWSISKQNK